MMWYCDQLITSEWQRLVSTIFFSFIWFFDIQNTSYLIVKAAFCMPFTWLSKCRQHCRLTICNYLIPTSLLTAIRGWKKFWNIYCGVLAASSPLQAMLLLELSFVIVWLFVRWIKLNDNFLQLVDRFDFWEPSMWLLCLGHFLRQRSV